MKLNLDRKKRFIIVIVIAVAVYYLFFHKKDVEEIKANTNANYAKGQQENITPVITSEEQEKYNLLRQKHYELSGYYPPSSYTAKQIQASIDTMEAQSATLDKIVEISGNTTPEEYENMSLDELERQLSAIEKDKQKKNWNDRKKTIEADIANLKYTLNGPKYNSEMLIEPIANISKYTDSELCYATRIFGRAPVVQPFNTINRRKEKTFFDAIGKQGNSDTHNKERSGTSSFYSYAQQIIARRSRVEGKTVDEYGVMH